MRARFAGVAVGIAAMVVVVTASNFLVQYPINDLLTWGAFTYPVAFLITDLTNRALGPTYARRVVYAGFAAAVVLSIFLATPRIAIASGSAFLVAQLLDIAVFDHLRRSVWWRAPLISSVLASALDTALFFSLAFAGTGLPETTWTAAAGFGTLALQFPVWVGWAVGDYAVKLTVAALMLIPFRALHRLTRPVVA